MPGRFLKAFESLASFIPEVRAPERRVSFNEKILWTVLALVLFLVMSEVPLYGIGGATEQLLFYRVIFASSKGTLMELGIGPIVTAGLILQLLAGSGFIQVDFSNPEDRSMFTGASKVLSLVMTGIQASAYLFGGFFGTVGAIQAVIVFVELMFAGLVLMLLDEMIQKGWGIGSGISLFILAGVAQKIMLDCFSTIPVGEGDSQTRYYGVITASIQRLFQGGSFDTLLISPGNYPSLLGLLLTIIVFLFCIYAQGIRVELPVTYASYRGFRGKYPINLLYVSNLPVIFASALFGNIYFISQLLWNNYGQTNFGPWIGLLGQYTTGSSGQLVPSGGLVYYVLGPNGFSDFLATPLRYLIYAVILVAFCIVFSAIWLQVGGLDPKTVAKQLMDSGMQIPGFRRSERPITMILKRYIPVVAILGGLIVGLLAAIADFFGAFGTGTGILLSVGIIYQYYQQIMRERAEDMYPGLKKFLGG